MKLMAPIPGMSLTKEPGNSPWEQPPLYNTTEEALAYYLDKMDDEEVLDEMLFSLEMGYPVSAMVDFLTSHSVMEGRHSFDVKMLIAPVLHEYIVSLAQAADINFVEEVGPSKEERINKNKKKRQQALILKALEEGGNLPPSEESVDKAEDLLEGEGEDEEEMSSPLIKRRG